MVFILWFMVWTLTWFLLLNWKKPNYILLLFYFSSWMFSFLSWITEGLHWSEVRLSAAFLSHQPWLTQQHDEFSTSGCLPADGWKVWSAHRSPGPCGPAAPGHTPRWRYWTPSHCVPKRREGTCGHKTSSFGFNGRFYSHNCGNSDFWGGLWVKFRSNADFIVIILE